MSKNGPSMGRRGGPMGHGAAAPVEKAKNFKGSFMRLLSYLKPQRFAIIAVMVMAIISTCFTIAAPKIMGNATNVLFEGVISQMMTDKITSQVTEAVTAQIPAGTPQDVADEMVQKAVDAALQGTTKENLIESLRSNPDSANIADMLEDMDIKLGSGVDFRKIGRILLILIGVYVISAVFMWAQHYIMAGVTQKTMYNIRREVDLKLSRLPLSYYDTTPRGDILSRVTNDIDNIGMSLQQSLTQIISAVFTVIGVLVMMLTISPILTLVSLVTLPVCMIVVMMITKRSRKQFTRQWDTTGTLNAHVEEMYTGSAVVKVFGREEESMQKFIEENDKLYESSFKAQFISNVVMPTMNFINNLNYVIICVAGGIQIIQGRISLGDVQAFINYSKQFTQPIAQTASVTNQIQSAIASAERVFTLLDAQEEVLEAENPTNLEKAMGYVTFNDVSFRYVPDQPLIEHMNIDVNPGQTVAIVGPTGAGKTTLVNLLMRFYELDKGEIYIDGVDIKDMTRENLRSHFGMVLQDTWLFNGTIYDNIAYGCENCTEEQVHEAAKAAYVDHFVKTLPEGYQTVLNDDATNLSQGQKQLLTIARAFLSDPNILILDEATSSVDTRTEVLIQKAMERLMKNRTSFVIAHRLSTIRDADIIIVMKEGHIVEQGNHEELLEKKGFYYELYNSQFANRSEDAVS